MAVKRRIVFIPFTRNASGDWDEAAGGEGVSWDANRYSYVWVDDLTTSKAPFAFPDNTSDTQIYVAGHGGDGFVHIENMHTQSTRSVDASTLVGFFIAGGLSRTFSGSIKFYNCESAMSNGTTETSFACRCASFFVTKGYTKARFFGYSGGITTGYEDYTNPRTLAKEGPRKHAIRNLDMGGGRWVSSTLGRASEIRKEIVLKKKGFLSNEYTLVIR